MSPANTVVINVQFNVDVAIQNITQLNTQIINIGTETEEASNKATNSLAGFERAINSVSQALLGMGLEQALQHIIMIGNEINRLQRGFEALPDGVDAMKELEYYSNKTGISITELARSANLMKNAGVNMKDAVAWTEAFANRMQAARGSQEDMNKAVAVFTNLLTKEYVTSRDLYTGFKGIGLGMMEVVKAATGMSVQQLKSVQVMKTMRVSDLAPLIVDAAARQGGTAAVDESTKNLTQVFGKLTNAAAEFGAELQKALGPGINYVVDLLVAMLKVLTAIVHAFNEIPEPVRSALSILLVVGGAIFALVKALTLLKAAMAFGGLMAEGGLLAGFVEFLPIILLIAGTLLTVYGILRGLHELGVIKFDVDSKIADAKGYLGLGKGKQPGELSDEERAKHKANLIGADEQRDANEIKLSQDALDQAQKKYALAGKDAIGALMYEYEEMFRKVKDSTVAQANVRKAAEIAVATEVRKIGEEHDKNIRKIEMEQEVTKRQIANLSQTLEPDDTYAGKIRDAYIAAKDKQVEVDAQAQDKIRENNRITEQQAESIRKSTLINDTQRAIQLADLKKHSIAENAALQESANLKVHAAELEALKKENELNYQYMQQRRDQELANESNNYQRMASLRQAVITATKPDTPQERIKEIVDMREAQIKGIEDVAAAQKFRDKEELMRKEELAYWDQAYEASFYETKERLEAVDKERQEKAIYDVKMVQINAWKEANEAILAEQLKVYDTIKGFLGQVFDAALDRSKSFWSALGNIIKTTMIGAIKAIVTSQFAASLTTMFGYGGFHNAPIRGPFDITRQPIPNDISGAPTMPSSQGAPSNLYFSGTGSAQRMIGDDISSLVRQAQYENSAQGSASQGSASRSMDGNDQRWYNATQLPDFGQVTTPTFASGGRIPGVDSKASASGKSVSRLQGLQDSFNIGKPIVTGVDTVNKWGDLVSAGGTIPWSDATATQKLGAIATSKGVGSLAFSAGSMFAIAGMQKRGVGAGVETVGGAALGAIGLGQMFPALFGSTVAAAGVGVGAGLTMEGLKIGGYGGLGMDVAGGALLGATLGSFVPGIGTAVGAALGAGIGALAGVIRLMIPGQLQKIRALIQGTYGVDISNQKILQQIADIANQKYGGDNRMAVMSTEVQDLVRLYSLSTGQNPGRLPRPMYSATFAQSQAGGLQLQPVYSGGQMVANPYTGTTTTQFQNALTQSLYIQLNPSHAQALFAGQVVNVMNSNPGAVASANTTAVQAGQGRQAQTAALLEPATVLR